jgi:hypothetical protein
MTKTILTIGLILSVAALVGCEPTSGPAGTTEQKLIAVEKTNLELTAKVSELENRIAVQDEQIATLQNLGDARMDHLFTVQSVKLGKFTGGWDFDGDDVEDGIRVFVIPQDQHDSLLKSAGRVKVQLYDLNAAPEEVLLAEYTYDASEVAEYWASGFMGSHFAFDCAWKDTTPSAGEATVRVEFVDALTGKTFRAQKLCPINRKPDELDEDAPAETPAE